MYKKKNIVIIGMIAVVLLMAVGYAFFQQNLTINGSANIASNWLVEFTKIEKIDASSGATEKQTPTASGTTATFDVNLVSPGDYLIYQITVANKGTLDAIIENIDASDFGNEVFKFEILEIKQGDKLPKSTTKTFQVKMSFDSSVTSQPSRTSNKLTVNIKYVQDVGQTITATDPDITVQTFKLTSKILEDNTVKFDSNGYTGAGLYRYGKGLSGEDSIVKDYFYGDVTNNYVRFANRTWRIVNMDMLGSGNVKLILDDTIEVSPFNTTGSSNNGGVGYMYGADASNEHLNSYAITHSNDNSSSIKTVLDIWFSRNLMSYLPKLVNGSFCNDRSLSSGLGYGENSTVYAASARISSPKLGCKNSNDLFGMASGNQKLSYPIGLITLDEILYASGIRNIDIGAVGSMTQLTGYLNIGKSFWTMTPAKFDTTSYVWAVYNNIGFNNVIDMAKADYGCNSVQGCVGGLGVRPVIELSNSVTVYGDGNGTQNNPYVVVD